MICERCKCKWYTVLVEDDGDVCGTPWCLLADTALPDDCFWPFNCIVDKNEEEAKNA